MWVDALVLAYKLIHLPGKPAGVLPYPEIMTRMRKSTRT